MTISIKERPILFKGAMVRAIHAGNKTQTRRANGLDFINENPSCWQVQWGPDKDGKHWLFTCGDDRVQLRCPYGVEGDRLWVRETHAIVPRTAYAASVGVEQVLSPANNHDAAVYQAGWDRSKPGRWLPSIHMPRWASRILLEIVSVRVERLRDISEADARAEGYSGFMDFYDLLSNADKMLCDLMNEDVDDYARRKGINYPIEWYHMLWDKINGTNAWFANPWVWVVEFKRIDNEGKEVARA